MCDNHNSHQQKASRQLDSSSKKAHGGKCNVETVKGNEEKKNSHQQKK